MFVTCSLYIHYIFTICSLFTISQSMSKYMSFCVIWLVQCYSTMSSCCNDFPFMALSSSPYCIDLLPFMVYSMDLSADCTIKCFNYHVTHAYRVAAVVIWRQPGSTTLPVSLKRFEIIQWCASYSCHLCLLTIHDWLLSSRKFQSVHAW